MRFLLGFAAGIAAAWAALAIWQRVPEFPDIDAEGEGWSAPHEDYSFPPPPVTDPKVHVDLGAFDNDAVRFRQRALFGDGGIMRP